jgi:hypothetical protein
MRTALFFVLVLFAVGCGSEKCASEFSGHWVGTTRTDSIELGDNCTFEYEGADGCKSTGTYAAPIASQGSLQASISASTDGECLPAGQYVCAYTASSTTFTFDCGAGASSYGR